MHLKLISLFGMCVMIAVAWALSNNRKLFPWRTVWSGLALQFAFALFILKTPWGAGIFNFLQHAVDKVGDFAMDGAKMVFGPLADKGALTQTFGPANGLIFAVIVAVPDC